MSNDALVKPDAAALERPSWVPKGDAGTEHITKDDLQMPRILLAQQMSPQVQRVDPTFIDGLEVGHLFNSLTGQIYGKGPLEFVVVRSDPPRYVEFAPREEGGGVIDPNVPPNDPRTLFRTDDRGKSLPPIATKFYDFVVALLPERELVALSFKSTGIRTARSLNAMIKLRQTPIYVGKYILATAMTTNRKGTFAVYQVRNAGWIDEADAPFFEGCYRSLAGKELNIAREPGGDDTEDTSFDPSQM